MNFKNLKYIAFALTALTFSSCDSMQEPEIEHAPIWPLAGEWLVHVYNQDGTPAVSPTTANPNGTLFALRTYNTSDNASDKAWMRLGTTQAVAVWGKVNCDPAQRIFTGTNIDNASKAGKTFSILNGQVMERATTLHSGVVEDSIAITYTTTFDNKTYTVKGHRTSHYLDDQY